MSATPPFVITPPTSTTSSSSDSPATAAAVAVDAMDISQESQETTSSSFARRRQTQLDAMASLPLGWTRVVPRNKRGRNGDDDCCKSGSSCRHRRRNRLLSSADSGTLQSGLLGSSVRRSRVSGHVIFCLHESNPEWFQGYFFPNRIDGGGHAAAAAAPSSWGLLAVQKELDECLQCSEGGYRVIDLTVTMSSQNTNNKKKIKLMDIEWTGGDMMDLKGSNQDIEMHTDCLLTGQAATLYMERFFGGLLRTLRAADTDFADLPILSLLPDSAIVTGNMTLFLPMEQHDEQDDANMMHMMKMLDQDDD